MYSGRQFLLYTANLQLVYAPIGANLLGLSDSKVNVVCKFVHCIILFVWENHKQAIHS